MPAYIAFMHRDATSQPSTSEWSAFFATASSSGMFRGGSSLGPATVMRRSDALKAAPDSAICGFMQFTAESLDALQPLLEQHPWHRHGGTIELRPLQVD